MGAADSLPAAAIALPGLDERTLPNPSMYDRTTAALTVPLIVPIGSYVVSRLDEHPVWWDASQTTRGGWLGHLAAALLFGGIAFGIAWRYAFPPERTWLWSGIAFLLGASGILLMIAMIEWPALERCASCGRPRVVTHERCEHCGAEFPSPPEDGTEVFDNLATQP
jgi:hypothetical protein